jgi:2-polyprenyl-6-methoxyphenol hydroxylase-like FAD-dependent oxidoreductase
MCLLFEAKETTMATYKKTILISGASIAGPTLAYWLTRYGFTPTVVERSPVLRTGGFPVDVRNEGVEIAKQMGIWSDLRQKITTLDRLSFMDTHNRRISGINILTLRKLLDLDRTWAEIRRGDLAETLYEATKNEVEYLFGDSIQTMAQDDDGVEVTFASGGTRRFDLVAGADGLHSMTRQLVFGDEARFEWYCGYQVAVFTTDNYLGLDHAHMLIYGVPGKQVMVRSSKGNKELVACFMFKQPTKLRYDRSDGEQQKQLLADAFANQAWEIPTLLEKMRAASDLYFDPVSQIRMESWSQGRVVLLGDAAHCPALLTGQGSTLAMMGAYLLAGELQEADGNYRQAFQQYEQAFRPMISKEQKKIKAGGDFLVPTTSLSMWTRNHLSSVLYPFIVVPGGIWNRFFPQPPLVKDYGSLSKKEA